MYQSKGYKKVDDWVKKMQSKETLVKEIEKDFGVTKEALPDT